MAEFFSFQGDCNYDFHRSLEKALKCANDALQNYQDEAVEGWPEESLNIRVGVVTHQVQTTVNRPATEDDPCFQHGCTEYEERELLVDESCVKEQLVEFMLYIQEKVAEFHGCTTGDCPHDVGSECAKEMVNEFLISKGGTKE